MSDSKFTHTLSKPARATLILSLTELWQETVLPLLSAAEARELGGHFEACEWRRLEDRLRVILTAMEPSDDAVRVATLIEKASVLRASKR